VRLLMPMIAFFVLIAVSAAQARGGACSIVVDQLIALHAPATDASKTYADTLFGLTLESPGAEKFSGHLVLQTDDDQYVAAFPEIALNTDKADATKYATSQPLFIAFDKPTAVTLVWLDDMTQSQKTFACPPRPIIFDRTYLRTAEKTSVAAQLQEEAKIRGAAGTPQATLRASFVGPLSSLPCRTPNAEATAFQLAEPRGAVWGLTGTTEVVLTLERDGTVVETRVFKSSGSDLLDNIARQSARESRYTPRIVNCRPTVGQYKYVVEFQGNRTRSH